MTKKGNYEDWKGNNRFFLRGKFMTGSSKDNLTLALAYGGITIALIVYTFTISKYLTHEINFFFSSIAYIFFFAGLYNMLKTTFSDPGVLPRGSLESAEAALEGGYPLDQENGCSHSSGLLHTSDPASERILEITTEKGVAMPDLSIYKHRYCSTCKIMRPPKASHCSDCNNCVKNFDHHCYFVGNCIGRRNHKYFFLFLFYATLYCIFTMLSAIIGLIDTIADHPELQLKVKNQLEYWIFSGIFLLIGMLCCNPRYCVGVKFSFIAFGLTIGLIGVAVASKGLKVPFYQNPLIFMTYIVVLTPFALWIVGTFFGCLWGISAGLTFKEKVVIEREVLDSGRRRQILTFTVTEKIANIKEFLSRPQVDSLIHGVC